MLTLIDVWLLPQNVDMTNMNNGIKTTAFNMLTPAIGYGPVPFNIVMCDFNCDFKPSLVSIVIYFSLMLAQYGPKRI
jgi:hypothetical protein